VGGDGYGTNGAPGTGLCEIPGGHTACSTFDSSSPAVPGMPIPTSTSGGICARGTAAQVVVGSGGTPDYMNIWGAFMAFDLDNPGNGGGGKLPFDAPARGVTGISFTIDTPPGNSMRVEFQTSASPGLTDNNPAYWNGAISNSSPVVAGTNTIRWASVGGPMYETNPPAFDPTKLVTIEFAIVTNTLAAVPFSFCISNVTLLTN
jgi:hypothetical protein